MNLLHLLLVSALSFTIVWSAQCQTIRIAVTSDVHGRFFPDNHLNDGKISGSLAAVHAAVEYMRLEVDNLILLDNGDLLQGTPAAYYSAYEQKNNQSLFSRIMNFMGYDAATVGNHDIECGPNVYNTLKNEFNFPYLGANVINTNTNAPHFQPYTIVYRGDIKIAVLGLTTPSIPNWLPPHLYKDLYFEDMVESARKWVGIIMENEKPDALVGLFHSGLGKLDVDSNEHPLEHASAYIAKYVPGFDIIFTGHDHGERAVSVTNINGSIVSVVGPRHHAEYLGIADLTFSQQEDRSYQLTKISKYVQPINKDKPSPSFMSTFERDIDDIKSWANTYICAIDQDIDAISSLFGPSRLTDIIHGVQLSFEHADISIAAPLSFNDTIKVGDLYRKDLFKLYPFENYLYIMSLTGQEIVDYLEYSVGEWFNTMASPDDPLLNFRRDQGGDLEMGREGSFRLMRPYFNLDGAAGINYTVDVTQSPGSRIVIKNLPSGKSFNLTDSYRVAINSYRGSGGGSHLIKGAGIDKEKLSERILVTSDVELRSLIGNYLKSKSLKNSTNIATWQVIPQDWAETAKEKDIEHLLIRNR